MKTTHVISLISQIRDRANRLIVRELNARQIRDLAPSHGDIVSILLETDGVSMKDLARRISRDKSTVTALVRKLAVLGYVERREDPSDQRVTLVGLTDKGRRLREEFDEISRILLETAYAGFSTEDKEEIIRGLERLAGNL